MTNPNIEKLSKKIRHYKVAVFILALSIPVAGYFTPQYFGLNPISSNKFPLLDPLRQFVTAESYITNIQDLRDFLQKLGTQYPDSVSIYYENINSGANIAVNKDLHLFPASLSKLVQAIIIAKKIEEGNLSWDTKLKVEVSDLSSDSGELYRGGGDRMISVEELLKELLVHSDNTAQNVFRRQLDISDYITFQENTGLEDLYNEKGFISAKEYTRILRVLYTSNFLKPENSEKILDCMSDATFHGYLSQGIPSDIQFAHKYGENKDYSIFADSGIVYVPGKPYMITVIIKGTDSTNETRAWAAKLMKEISEHTYQVSK